MTSVQFFIQQAINAISIGSLYALMAIGLAMVFGILRLINFAHGDLIMVGSYAALLLLWAGLPFWLAALAGIAASGLAMDDYAAHALRDFVWGFARLQLRPLPLDVAAVVHLLLVSVLMLVLPFSKLLHGVALFFNPTRYQPDAARLPAGDRRADTR